MRNDSDQNISPENTPYINTFENRVNNSESSINYISKAIEKIDKKLEKIDERIATLEKNSYIRMGAMENFKKYVWPVILIIAGAVIGWIVQHLHV